MTALATTPRRSISFGLTVYVAFLLTISARAAQNEQPVPPMPGAPATDQDTPDRVRSYDEDPGSAPTGLGPATPPPVGSPTPFGPLPPPAPPFRDSIYGAHATPGMPGSPGHLHPHYPEYQTKYGIWYQPRSYHEPHRERYRPSPWRPRGWGNLFAEDCRDIRMDYNRYVVQDLPSRYGPSYYPKYHEAAECLFRPERKYHPPYWGSAE